MASFFSLNYKPTNSPNLDVSSNLGIALEGFKTAGKGLSDLGKAIHDYDQNQANTILAERMLGLKTEEDFHNAMANGNLLRGIQGRSSADALEKAMQNRFTMLTKDEERRKLEAQLTANEFAKERANLMAARELGDTARATAIEKQLGSLVGRTDALDILTKGENSIKARNQLLAERIQASEEEKKYYDRRKAEQNALVLSRLLPGITNPTTLVNSMKNGEVLKGIDPTKLDLKTITELQTAITTANKQYNDLLDTEVRQIVNSNPNIGRLFAEAKQTNSNEKFLEAEAEMDKLNLSHEVREKLRKYFDIDIKRQKWNFEQKGEQRKQDELIIDDAYRREYNNARNAGNNELDSATIAYNNVLKQYPNMQNVHTYLDNVHQKTKGILHNVANPNSKEGKLVTDEHNVPTYTPGKIIEKNGDTIVEDNYKDISIATIQKLEQKHIRIAQEIGVNPLELERSAEKFNSEEERNKFLDSRVIKETGENANAAQVEDDKKAMRTAIAEFAEEKKITLAEAYAVAAIDRNFTGSAFFDSGHWSEQDKEGVNAALYFQDSHGQRTRLKFDAKKDAELISNIEKARDDLDKSNLDWHNAGITYSKSKTEVNSKLVKTAKSTFVTNRAKFRDFINEVDPTIYNPGLNKKEPKKLYSSVKKEEKKVTPKEVNDMLVKAIQTKQVEDK